MIMIVALAVLAFCASSFITLVCYLVVSRVKFSIEDAKARGEDVWWAWRAVGVICGVIGYPGDLLWNAIIGTWTFREFPKWHRLEFTFTARVKRHHRNGVGFRKVRADRWFKRLNDMWTDHIKVR